MKKTGPDFSREQGIDGLVAGIDEVGRGPLAGPVIACAVIFPHYAVPPGLEGLTDSKQLSDDKRRQFASILRAHVLYGLGAASVAEIDRLNILQASLLAMRRAYRALPCVAAFALVDGNRDPNLPCPTATLVGGDGKSHSIAAASVIAKVARDRLMTELDRRYPGYGWAKNAGYGTAQHRAALVERGITPHHRRTFAPIREILKA